MPMKEKLYLICSAEQQHSNSLSQNVHFSAFFYAKSANSTVFRMGILWGLFSVKSANSIVFRMRILLEFFSAKCASELVFFWIFSAKSDNSTVFRISILLAFFSAKSAKSTSFRIRILLASDIFLREVYRFQQTLQTSDAQKNTPLMTIAATTSPPLCRIRKVEVCKIGSLRIHPEQSLLSSYLQTALSLQCNTIIVKLERSKKQLFECWR